MTQLACRSCGLALAESDRFCGNCGAQTWPAGDDDGVRPVPRTPPGPRDSVRAGPRRAGPALSDRFFGYAARQPDVPLTNATRYLCAAAYLDPTFANAVIGELVASRRAVAPSIGIDLGPVIRHCLNSRRIQLIRDVILAILLVSGLVLATLPTVLVLTIGLALTLLPGGERRTLGGKILSSAIVAFVVIIIAVIGIYLVINSFANNALPVGLLGGGAAKTIILTLIFAILTGAAACLSPQPSAH